MINFQLNQQTIKYLKTLVKVSSSYLEGPQEFIFTEDGLKFHAMDQTGSNFILFSIQKEFFTSYNLNKHVALSFILDDFEKILARSMEEEEIFSFIWEDSNIIDINYIISNSNAKKRYELVIHDPVDTSRLDNSEAAVSIPLDIKITCEPGTFKEILNDISIGGEKGQKHLTITGDQDLIAFEVINNINLRAYKELPTDETNKYKITSTDSQYFVTSLYDLEYIDKLAKLDSPGNKISIEFGDESPIRIIINLHDSIEFMLVTAPLDLGDDSDDDSDPDDKDNKDGS